MMMSLCSYDNVSQLFQASHSIASEFISFRSKLLSFLFLISNGELDRSFINFYPTQHGIEDLVADCYNFVSGQVSSATRSNCMVLTEFAALNFSSGSKHG